MKILKKLLGHVEQYIAVLCLTLMLCVLTYNTISRYFFHVTLPWAEEMCAYGQIWLVYISVSYAVKENAHVCIDSVMSLYPKKLKGVILLLGLIAWLIFGIIMTVVGYEYMLDIYNKGGRAISVPVPMWLIYLSIPVGHLFLCFRLLQQIVLYVKCIAKGIDPTELLGETTVDGIDLSTGELAGDSLHEAEKLEGGEG